MTSLSRSFTHITLLIFIIITASTEIAQAASKKKVLGPDMNSPQYRPPNKVTQNFCEATNNRNFQMMTLFLQQGAEIDNENCGLDSETPLTRSFNIYLFSRQVAEFLINNGANVNYQNKNGQTALMQLVQNNNNDDAFILLPELFDHGAKVDLQNSLGNTALDFAVATGYNRYSMDNSLKIIRYLVKKGANVNHKNKSGTTPLMMSSKGCGVEVVKLLLSLGADPKTATPMGETALSMAEDSAASQSGYVSCNEVVRILQNPEEYANSGDTQSAPTPNGSPAPSTPSGNPLESLNNALMKLNQAISGH